MTLSHKWLLPFATILLVFNWSCQPEDNEPEYVPSEENPVFAGLVGSQFTSATFDPPMSIQIVWDEQNLYAYGVDSIDLDADLAFDVFFYVYDLNPDSLHLLDGQMPSPFPKVSVEVRNGYDLAHEVETFYIGLGQTAEASFAARFEANANLTTVDDWLDGDAVRRDLWSESPQGSMYPQGPWYEMAALHYLGFRKGNHEGWIEVDATNYRRPKILRWAME